MNIFLICFLSLMECGAAVRRRDYCEVSKQHVLCKYDCKTSRSCRLVKGEDGFEALDDEYRQTIVREHNKYRNEIAKGSYRHIKGAGFRQAENMMAISYDKELEHIAGCWLRQCIPGPNRVNRDMNGAECGENQSTEFGDESVMQNRYWALGVLARWFQEYNETQGRVDEVISGKMWSTKYGHFTQMIWAQTEYVGCAKMASFSKASGTYRYDLYCNYKPKGNVPGEMVYFAKPEETVEIIGETCENVSDSQTTCVPVTIRKPPQHYTGTCHKDVNARWTLCGKVRPLGEDIFNPPRRTGALDDDDDDSSALRYSLAKSLLIIPLAAIIFLI